MNKFNIFILLSFVITLTSGCNVVKEGFASPKKNSGDEFLVEKKSPLIMPPNYNELPIPSNENSMKNDKKNEIRDLIIKSKSNVANSSELDRKDQKLKNSILEKIKKD
tara:strand:- start:1660 stop:1983 length:324 start_codon:yes stop_codon:yes gene_type:complete